MRFFVLVVLMLFSSAPATASPVGDGDEPESSVVDRAAAAQAYDRASAYYLRGAYQLATEYYERAFRFAPSAEALIQALRSSRRTTDILHTVNLALRLAGLYPQDERAETLADAVLGEHAASFFIVELACEACGLEVDERIRSYPIVALAPDTPHRVVISRDERRVMRTVTGRAGERLVLTMPEPDPEPADALASAEGSGRMPPGVQPAPERSPARPPWPQPLPPWVFASMGGLTALAIGFTIWSGLDALSGAEAYRARPTPEAFADGEDRERRTNWLIGISIGMAAATAAAIVFTDWSR